MSERSVVYVCARAAAILVALLAATPSEAADIWVPAGGNLQAALDSARAGDTILLAPGATYVGNFRLPVHGGTTYVTVRTGGNDALLPGAGARIRPSHARYLAKLRSPNTVSALRTAPGAAYWRVMLVEFLANENGAGDIVKLGDNTTAQSSLTVVPRHLVLDRVYMHGDALVGQKRGIFLNSGQTSIINSHIVEMKAVSQDTQAIAGSNGPGPYHIENNHLEAAGQVFILGGDDPKIPGLVPADLLFRRNTLTRPLSWRNPIVPAPTGVSAAAAAGAGTLAAGTYAYRVVARRPAGTTTATSPRSSEVTAALGSRGGITLRWTAVQNASEYRVYGRRAGGQTMYWTVRTTSFTDTGAAGTAGTPPSDGTVWQVKNLFELKNCRRAQIDYNLMENNWLQAQSGIAILFTVRNQYGGCTQCVVEDIAFEQNVVRNVGAGVKILGRDYNHPSQQTRNIRIRNNVFSAIDRSRYGGTGYFLTMTESPRDVVVDHNTIVTSSGLGVVAVGDGTVVGFVFTNNVARHSSYGIFGGGFGYGTTAIAEYLPDGVIQRNVLAGGRASMYPPGNLFPTTAEFEAHFADYDGANYALVPGTDWAGAGTDRRDLGAATAVLATTSSTPELDTLRVITQSLPAAAELQAYAARVEAAGGSARYQWSIVEGSLPAGVVLDAQTGAITGRAAAAGDFAFTVRVADAWSGTATQRLVLHVERPVLSLQVLTTAVADGIATQPYAQRLDAVGGVGPYAWSVSAGSLPAGVALSPGGDLGGVPATSGRWSFTATAVDMREPTRRASRAFAMTVAPPPNRPPVVSVSVGSSSTVQVGAPVRLTAQASDSDGQIRSVDFFVNGVAVGSATAPPFGATWVVPQEGTHVATAVAVDDDGAAVTSQALSLTATAEIVLYAAEVSRVAGDFKLVADATAAQGRRLWNPNRFAAKILRPAASPTTFVEFTFYAAAGRPYRLWIRGKGETNLWSNDSAHVQFSGTVDASGAPIARIGTTRGFWYSVEEYVNARIMRWGWQDNGFGAGVAGAPLYFERTGPQTVRIQQREDGISIDQIVISPSRYFSVAPGLPKNDSTIVAK